MLCGYLRQTCRSIKVKDLIEILQLCKNQDAVIKLSGMTNFYIHFDQDGQFIDISKQANGDQYGESGKENTCITCHLHDNNTGKCNCTGEGCINGESMIDTKKYNELASRKEEAQEDTKSEAFTESIENKGTNISNYDLSRFSINGAESTQENNIKIEEKTIDNVPPVEIVHPVLRPNNIPESNEGWISLEDKIQELIDNALVNTLTKMIDGLKGDKNNE